MGGEEGGGVELSGSEGKEGGESVGIVGKGCGVQSGREVRKGGGGWGWGKARGD